MASRPSQLLTIEEGFTAPTTQTLAPTPPQAKQNGSARQSLHSRTGQDGSPRRSSVARGSGVGRESLVSNIHMNNNPGDYVMNIFPGEEAGEDGVKGGHGDHKLGTFKGVYMPTCLTMWGVIIFIRYGEVVGQAGVGQAILSAVLSAVVVALTASSVSALATNGVQSSEGGVYHLLTRSLGPSLGGSVSLLYFLGLTVMSTVEMVGFTEAVANVLLEEAGHVMTSSSYLDQIIFGVMVFAVVALCSYMGHKVVDGIGMVFMVILMAAYAAAIAGLIGSGFGWQVGEHTMANNATYVITGISWSTFQENMGPGYTDGKNFNWVLSYVFPCFIGIFTGANQAHRLLTPHRSIPLGGFSAILTSLTFYIIIFCLLGAVAPRETLKETFLLFELVAWPTKWITMTGMLVVGVGAAMELLAISQHVLKSIAADNIIPVLLTLGFDKELSNGVAGRSLGVALVIAFPFLFAPNLDFIATVVALLFLLAYALVNFSCFLMSVLQAPSWRPKFRFYHRFFTALLGFFVAISTMFTIQWIFTIVATVVFILVALYIEVKGSSSIWGQGVRGLKLHLALESLLAEEDGDVDTAPMLPDSSQQDELAAVATMATCAAEGVKEDGVKGDASGAAKPVVNPPAQQSGGGASGRQWRPQILALVRMETDGGIVAEHSHLLHFVRMLTKETRRGALIMVGSVVVREGQSTAEMATQVRERRAALKVHMKAHKLQGFTEVTSAPSVELGTNIMLQTAGLGSLRPNTVVVGWPSEDTERTASLIFNLITQARAENKALLCIKGLTSFPSTKDKLRGCIDIWWVVQEGGLLLLVGHLLKTHRTWRNCRLRLFTVAEVETNSVHIERQLRELLTALRIPAEVHVVELDARDFQPFTNEWTISRNQAMAAAKQRRAASAFPSCVDQLAGVAHKHPRFTVTDPTQSEPQANPATAATASQSQAASSTSEDETPVRILVTCASGLGAGASHASDGSNSHLGVGSDWLGVATTQRPPLPEMVNKQWLGPRLKAAMEKESVGSTLVIMNLPVPGADAHKNPLQYMGLINSLTEKLPRCILANGLSDGTQVLSIYN